MKTKIIQIGYEKYLDTVLKEIPTNTILFKTLPGIGATHMEIKSNRHSLIIEPNVPVILGKRKKFKDILGVHEGIDVYQIICYLKKSNIKYKKIITTPESFYKVKEAMENLQIDFYNTFFLMFDECEKTMKDVNFREKIVMPMNDFFKFKNKAFVSATAVIPTDPRFVKQGFQKLIIEPDFDFKQKMDLIITNHVSFAIKKKLETLESTSIFIFLNSTKCILNLINKLGIEEEANVYCSKSSMDKLSELDSKRVFDNLTDNFAKYNFLTSRFYSAVDILIEELPDVFIITDLWSASHTMIDPESDAIQIVGRFRNKVKSITTITNIDWNLNAKDEKEANGYLEGCKEAYEAIKALRDGAHNDGAIDVLSEALNLVNYSNFVNEDGSINYFMIDNYLNNERVKYLYKSEMNLLKTYSRSEHFKVKPFFIKYKVSDDGKPKIDKKERDYYKKLMLTTIKKLNEIFASSELVYIIDNSAMVMEELNSSVPEIVLAYKILSLEQILRCSSKRSLVHSTKEQQILNDSSNFSFIHKLNLEFKVGSDYSSNDIIQKLKVIISQYNLTLKPQIKLLRQYFEIKRPDSKNRSIYRIVSAKFSK